MTFIQLRLPARSAIHPAGHPVRQGLPADFCEVAKHTKVQENEVLWKEAMITAWVMCPLVSYWYPPAYRVSRALESTIVIGPRRKLFRSTQLARSVERFLNSASCVRPCEYAILEPGTSCCSQRLPRGSKYIKGFWSPKPGPSWFCGPESLKFVYLGPSGYGHNTTVL